MNYHGTLGAVGLHETAGHKVWVMESELGWRVKDTVYQAEQLDFIVKAMKEYQKILDNLETMWKTGQNEEQLETDIN